MYIPEHFRMSDEDVEAFLPEVRAGNLITVDENSRPLATFLPWVLMDGRLISHMGTVNPQSRHTGEALVVFMGDDAYICDEWMSGITAPTWDYETVHVYGDYRTHTDPEWIIDSWSQMLERFSHRTIGDYDPAWVEIQTRSVVGVEVVVTEIQAKSKLSQNRARSDVDSIISHLTPACTHLAARMTEVSLPHIAARDERVREIRDDRLSVGIDSDPQSSEHAESLF